MHIGIFGGTFDPPHIGHLLTAINTRHLLDLDEVQLMVANDPWQKSGERRISLARHRLQMVELAVADHHGLVAGDGEVRRGGPSYSIDTVVEALDAGATEIDLIVGRDTAAGLDSWHRSVELRELVTVAIVDRPGSSAEAPPGWRSRYVRVPQVDVSSTDLRRRWIVGEPVDVLIPQAVIAYIESVDLYPPPT